MKCLAVCFLLFFFGAAFAQTPQIKPDSPVYIEPAGGFGTYLVAAFMKKGVPVVIVADKSKAKFIITSILDVSSDDTPAVVINNTNTNGSNRSNDAFQAGKRQTRAERALHGATSASVSVVDKQTSQVLFAYSVVKNGNTGELQSAAEACAKHFREFIEKSEKKRK